MTTIECPSRAEIQALTLGRLPSEDSHALFEHLEHCAECRSELEALDDSQDSLICSLRAPREDGDFLDEPTCRQAVFNALGALSLAENYPLNPPQELAKRIGDYEILRPIGHGGMGSVYLARHTKLGREVALKVLASHRLADPKMRDRFESEMRAVGRLSHPNIVTAHDARDVQGAAVLVTEYVHGLDLGQLLLRTGRLSIPNACEIARQVASAMEYIHCQSFVHRDIKPSNVILSSQGHVKLLDLGLARLQYEHGNPAELTGTGQAMGTADYVAPSRSLTPSPSIFERIFTRWVVRFLNY